MVSHLLNVDKGLAEKVAEGVGLRELPPPAKAESPTRTDLKQSPALSILRNGPDRFEGRKVGALITDGVSVQLVKALKAALTKEGASLEFIAPHAGEVQASDGSWIAVQQRIDGAPSVLYDAVALLVSGDGGRALPNLAAARDFLSDAFAHSKFIAYVDHAMPLIEKVVGRDNLDAGFIQVKASQDVTTFIQACRKLRYWERAEAKLQGPARGDKQR